MTCLTASDLSLLETLEQKLAAEISVTLLAELERELFRLRCEFSRSEWEAFCLEFCKRRVFPILQAGTLTGSRLTDAAYSVPPDLFETATESFQGRQVASLSPSQLLTSWEYSLPASRSLRARVAYFSREISDVIRTSVKPRILVLGAGRMREAADALYGAHLHHAQLVALEHHPDLNQTLARKFAANKLEVRNVGCNDLPQFASTAGTFDLIYSPAWLDSTDDEQARAWLSACMEMLRQGGRILAANFTPGSCDAGWMEACWNWHPCYRSEEELAQLVINLKHPEVRGHAVFRDESGASAFLEIHSL